MSQTKLVMDMKKPIKGALWKHNRCSALYYLQCVCKRKTRFAATKSKETRSIFYSKHCTNMTVNLKSKEWVEGCPVDVILRLLVKST